MKEAASPYGRRRFLMDELILVWAHGNRPTGTGAGMM
jgi:hypothetical protein